MANRRMPVYEEAFAAPYEGAADDSRSDTHDTDVNDTREGGSHKLFWWLIFLALLIVFAGTSYLLGWTNHWSSELNKAFPGVNFDWMNNPAKEVADEPIIDESVANDPAPTQGPANTPPTDQGNAAVIPPTAAPTALPVATATPQPIYVATEPVATATPSNLVFTPKSEAITFKVVLLDGTKSDVTLIPFVFAGGPRDDLSPWYMAIAQNLEKEVPEAFGPPISTEDWAQAVSRMLQNICVDARQLTWFRFECYLEDLADMDAVNARAAEIRALPREEYDKLANEALEYFFKNLNDGTCHIEKDWNLEVMMKTIEGDNVPKLFAQVNNDTNHTPDTLIWFTAKGRSDSFHSNRKAMELAAKAAGVPHSKFYPRVYFNLTEGATYKWKTKDGKNVTPSNPSNPGSPSNPGNPGNPSSPTSTPVPESGKKNPETRPTPATGGGGTNPQNSADPHTNTHVESTPAPTNAVVPVSTVAPTAVPTAVVRPTEQCAPVNNATVPPLVREDTNRQPQGNDNHNVPTKETTGTGDDSFDPGSI